MNFFKRVSLIAVIFISIATYPVSAASIVETGLKATSLDQCSLVIEGEIEQGDSTKLDTVFARIASELTDISYKSDFVGLDYVVCLSGSGGDYPEAVAIAELLIEKAVATSVPVGATCENACAIAFMGGRDCCVEFGMTLTKRHLSRNSRLGLSAPTLDVSDGILTAEETAAAFEQSIALISEIQDKAATLDIGPQIINTIMSNRNGQVFYIQPDPMHEHNFVDRAGDVFQDIWVPGISGVVNQGTLDQN